jgi:hypothetical protein
MSGGEGQRPDTPTHPRLELRSLFFTMLYMATGTIARSTQLSIDDDWDCEGISIMVSARNFI